MHRNIILGLAVFLIILGSISAVAGMAGLTITGDGLFLIVLLATVLGVSSTSCK